MKTAIVTGGSAGIGASIVEHLLGEDFTVINLSRRRSAAQHDRLIDAPVDLADLDATGAVAGQLAADREITHLVLNAGVIRPDAIEDVATDDVDYLTRLHIGASVILLKACLPAMKRAAGGRVIVISSRALMGLEARTAYAATKAGQIGMMRTWALELGRHGVTVNAIAPGPIVTDMFTELVPDADKAGRIAGSIPMKRLGRPDDVARAVMFLLQPDNDFITGQCLFVCGGASLGSLSL